MANIWNIKEIFVFLKYVNINKKENDKEQKDLSDKEADGQNPAVQQRIERDIQRILKNKIKKTRTRND